MRLRRYAPASGSQSQPSFGARSISSCCSARMASALRLPPYGRVARMSSPRAPKTTLDTCSRVVHLPLRAIRIRKVIPVSSTCAGAVVLTTISRWNASRR